MSNKNLITINQKVKAYISEGFIVSAKEFKGIIPSSVPDNVVMLELETEWKYPTLSSRQSLVKDLEIFDPVKIEISTNYLMYKSFFIKTFLKSWRIRGPSVDLSNESASVDDIPCDIVDIMCEGMFSVTRDAEEALGKV